MLKPLTQDEVQLGVGLEGVVEGHEEGGLANVLQHLALRARVFGRLGLLHDGGLLQHLHGVQLPGVVAAHLPDQEHFPVRWGRAEGCVCAQATTNARNVKHPAGTGPQGPPRSHRCSQQSHTHLRYPGPSAAQSSPCRPAPRDPSGLLQRRRRSLIRHGVDGAFTDSQTPHCFAGYLF